MMLEDRDTCKEKDMGTSSYLSLPLKVFKIPKADKNIDMPEAVSWLLLDFNGFTLNEPEMQSELVCNQNRQQALPTS